jgi:hypothetical protein
LWPRPSLEEVPVSFASEPGRDDGSLPPLNVVIPDDARELDRDVLAYRREIRAKRRRDRFGRLLRPFNRAGLGTPATVVPFIAACLALTLVGGALLSVVTISPASAPTLGGQSASAVPTLTTLPAGSVELDGKSVPVRSLVSSAIALVPANCGCGTALRRLADQARTAKVSLYFVGSGTAVPQLATLTAHYGAGTAKAADDPADILGAAYHPVRLTVLLVFRDGSTEVRKDLTGDFQLGPTLSELTLAGRASVAPTT